jgi:tetratricopeptide (TPR) repeat protein
MSELLQQAIASHQAGNLNEAERLYRSVLASEPEQPDALALLGLALDAKGDHTQAIALIESAIRLDPRAALFKLHLANALMGAERFREAAAVLREAIQLQPDIPQAYFNLGNALRRIDDWKGAIVAYREAIGLDSNYAEACNNIALALVHEAQHEEAMDYARRAVTVAPDYGDGWLTLCNIAEQVKDYKTALAAGERVVYLLPHDHRAWFGCGVVLNRLGRDEEAIEIYKHTLALKPERADIWDNLGQTYQSLNRLEEAEATFRKTIEVAGQVITGDGTREIAEEEYGNRHWHLALMELLRGKYKAGFARYRARFREIGDLKRPLHPQPLWRGENLSGKTLLVHDEQGYGDTLMFCRYLPLLKKRGARVIFYVHPALAPLFKGWEGADQIVMHGQPVSGFDYHATTFDLPHRFGTMLETIPAEIPYLPPLEPDDNTELVHDGRMKVGVVWGGSPLHKNDDKRSIPLETFAAIFNEPGMQFCSLNRDMKTGDMRLLPRYPVIDLSLRLHHFGDAARFMRQMDLIITCDTATAHLAGGLGKPVWTLLPFAPDWRWLTGRDDSPWYPTMRLFRQSRAGDWEGVMARVKAALRE